MSTQATLSEGPDFIVYGGAFDPPHSGHVEILALALKRFPKAAAYVLPAAQPAAAGTKAKKVYASFEQRLRMTALAFATEEASRLRVLPLERELPSPNYTLNTLQQLAKDEPRQRFAFLMGQDQLAAFSRWYEPKSILGLAELVVAPRPAAHNHESLRATVEAAAKDLGMALRWADATTAVVSEAVLTSQIHLLPPYANAANSTELRRLLATGAAIPQGWLPPAVNSYIKQHEIYQEGEGSA